MDRRTVEELHDEEGGGRIINQSNLLRACRCSLSCAQSLSQLRVDDMWINCIGNWRTGNCEVCDKWNKRTVIKRILSEICHESHSNFRFPI